MKRTVLHILMAAVSFCAVLSCEKEPAGPGGKTTREEGSWSFTATFENPAARVTDMDDSGNFAWQNNDEIKIVWEGGSATANASVADGVATFKPAGLPEKGTALWMVYPADVAASLNEGKFEVGMPAARKNRLAAFFVARAEVGAETVAFKHPVCYYKVVVDGDGADVTRLEVSSASGKNLTAATLSLSFDEQGIPAATPVSGVDTVTVAFDGEGTYYVPVVPGVSPEAGDLLFQFYCGNDKVGAYNHSEAIDNVRSSILNWGSLPAKATNRYVSIEGTGTADGTSADTPWNFTQFKALMEKSSIEASEAPLYDGIRIHFAAGTYNTSVITPALGVKVNIVGEGAAATVFDAKENTQFYNHTSVPAELSFKGLAFKNAKHPSDNGACFRVKNTSVVFEDCVFTDNQAPASNKGGGVANAWGTSSLSFKNCSFYGNYGISGGVLYIQGTTAATLEGCTFTGNHASNGACFFLSGDATVKCTDCTFGDGTDGNKNYSNLGAVLYANGSNNKAWFTDCVIDFNKGTANWGNCIMFYGSGITPRLYLNGCVFKNNVGVTRGVIAAQNASALIYMNGVAFYNNSYSDATNAGWGLAVHCGNSIVCMNNVTACENTPGGYGKNWVVFNSDGAWLITNSTIVNKAPTALIRANNDARKTSLCNNVLINTWEPYNTLEFKAKQTSCGHNVISRDEAYSNFATDDTDKIAVESLTDGAYSEPVYTWTNNLEAFSAADQAALKAVYDAYNESIAGVSHVGTDFYNWLVNIGAIDKDGRGQTRTGTWWPGAYQNN